MNNYSITFKSLRAGTVYTVNIGGGTGAAIPLKPGAQPFVTEEDSDEDMFTPIRTQTGYLRIMDDNRDSNGDLIKPSDPTNWWKDLIPATDTARPVTLTHQSGGSTIVDWQGFMQAQDFGNTLYGNPQEREFPIQCVLSVTQGTDINYQQTQIQNFAYLLKQVVDSIPSAQRPTSFMIQGGTDAQAWLLKKIDWQNFVSEDGDGNLTARYSMYDCLEDMCRFWGWTARTKGSTLYLTMADDATTEPNWLSMDDTDLATMAGGTAAGTTADTFDTTTLTGDIFANTSQNDYVQRGHNKAVVTAETNRGDDDVLNVFNNATIEEMEDLASDFYYEHEVRYSRDLLDVTQPYIEIHCREGYASLNIARFDYQTDNNVVRIKKTGGNNVSPFVELKTVYSHNFNDGFLRMYGQIYRYKEEYIDPYREDFFIGRSYMYARIAIGESKANAMWWNGRSWQSSPTYCRLSIGNTAYNGQYIFPFMYLQESQASENDWACNILPVSNLHGKLYIDLLGTNNARVPDIDNEKLFDIKDLKIEFTRNPGVIKYQTSNDMVPTKDIDRPTSFEYKSTNQNNVRNEWNADCVYATENKCKFSYGELINPDFSFCENVDYGNLSARPEQHLANRVVNYWASSKRRMEVELRTNAVADITPKYKTTIDGTTGYPIAISRDWRDDITKLTILEL